MEILHIGIILLIFFFAAFMKGITGLGFSTICVPLLTMIVGVKDAISLVLLPSILSNLVTMRTAGQFNVTIKRFWPLFLATIPGLLAGLYFLAGSGDELGSAILGAVLIFYAVFTLLSPELILPKKREKHLYIPVGLTTGLINGATGSQVMPVLPYLMSLQLERNQFVQALNCSFTLSSLIMIVGMSALSILSFENFLLSLSGGLCVFAGVHMGTIYRNRMPPAVFRNMILVFLILLGVSLIFPYFLNAL